MYDRVLGRIAGEQELVEAQAERGSNRRIHLAHRAASEQLGDVIRGCAPLDGTVGEALCSCALGAV